MHLEDIAAGAMKPSENNDVVADAESVESLRGKCTHFEPCVGSTFRALFGCVAARFEGRADYADGTKLVAARRLFSHLRKPSVEESTQEPANHFRDERFCR